MESHGDDRVVYPGDRQSKEPVTLSRGDSEKHENRLIVDTLITFIGEHTGRKLIYKLIGTGKHKAQDGRLHVTSVYDKLLTILMTIKKQLTPGVPYLLQVAYHDHYTGIRVELIGSIYKVYMLDPAEGQGLYTPLPFEIDQLLKHIFGVNQIHRAVACQLDESDTFCQTWSLVLLSNPGFQTKDHRQFLLDLYKTVAQSSEFLNWLSGRNLIMPTIIYRMMGWDTGHFASAVE
jgi:hypothetical protein